MTACPRCSRPLNFDGGCVAHGEPSAALAVDDLLRPGLVRSEE